MANLSSRAQEWLNATGMTRQKMRKWTRKDILDCRHAEDAVVRELLHWSRPLWKRMLG